MSATDADVREIRDDIVQLHRRARKAARTFEEQARHEDAVAAAESAARRPQAHVPPDTHLGIPGGYGANGLRGYQDADPARDAS